MDVPPEVRMAPVMGIGVAEGVIVAVRLSMGRFDTENGVNNI